MKTRMSYIAAIGAAQLEAMKADERVIVIGEDVEANVYGTTGGSRQRAEEGDFVQMFGRNRVRNTPISEETIVGATIGAGRGMRHRKGDMRGTWRNRRPGMLQNDGLR